MISTNIYQEYQAYQEHHGPHFSHLKCASDWDSQNCRSGMPMHARQIQLEFSMLACKPAMTGGFLLANYRITDAHYRTTWHIWCYVIDTRPEFFNLFSCNSHKLLLVEACLASCVTHHDEVVRIQSATLLRRAALAEADPWHKVWRENQWLGWVERTRW